MPPRNIVRTVVLAKNLQAFHAWCLQTGRSPRDRTILYASGPSALRGLTGPVEIVRYGDWWERIDREALEDAVAWLHHRNAHLLEAAHA